MAAIQTVPQHLQHCNFAPISPRHGVVTLFGYGTSICVDRGHLTIEDGIGKQRRYARFPRVGHGLKRLVVIGSDGLVSLAALRWLADQGSAFVMLDRLGEVIATAGPVHPSDARLRRAQSLAESSGVALRIAIELIKRKLLAQERLVRDRFQDDASAEVISGQGHALMKATSREEIRRCEAHAALAYWRVWHELSVQYPQSDSRRVPEHWRRFGSRLSPLTKSPRLAVNPANAMLNYLYAILESEARLAISELGLDPGLGVLHSDTRTRDSLACDLMEPIRPQVDAFLLDWLRSGLLQRKWFFEERDGNCRLTGEFAAQLSETSKLWKQALGPSAEWMLRALWSGSSTTSKIEAPATRLTQDRKREAKGILTQSSSESAVTQRTMFTKTMSNEFPQIPKLARLDRFDPVAQSRRAESQRRQAAALKAWNPAEKPDWLNEKIYRERVQPLLSRVMVPKIMSELSVSEPYALQVRAGQRIPHPRHWLALANLVGISLDL
ncbi:MAG: CRISPR-associated endonuclease Cas1 [Candidatus Acidiferrum sp.]